MTQVHVENDPEGGLGNYLECGGGLSNYAYSWGGISK